MPFGYCTLPIPIRHFPPPSTVTCTARSTGSSARRLMHAKRKQTVGVGTSGKGTASFWLASTPRSDPPV